jgi:hypothetical protein
MTHQNSISISFLEGQKINGLGLMIGQYLEQNLDEFEYKLRQALKLNITTSVEVEKGISTTITFARDNIKIQNGVSQGAHIHLKSSYSTLADVLSGKINPIRGVMDGRIEMVRIPATRPFQALKLLRFLKIPEELLVEVPKPGRIAFTRERVLIFMSGAGCGFVAAYLIMFLTGE